MIELSQLNKVYPSGVTALKDINLTVNRGEIFGVIGPSGAGKSSLIRCINLLERPSHGKVIVDDEDLILQSKQQLRITRRKIGMIFQQFNLLSARTVYANVALPLIFLKKKRHEIDKIITPLLELTGLTEKQHAYPAQLSGGQKQRVAIARALATQPKVLLSDEATSSLDPETTRTILQLLKSVNQELGVTILLITHEMDVVKEICGRLAILQNGEIVEQTTTVNFFMHAKSDIAKTFIRHASKHQLPKGLRDKLLSEAVTNSNPIVRLSFLGSTSQEPLISKVVREFSIDINILQANIEPIGNDVMGTMLVEVSGAAEKITAGIEFLTAKNIHIETIGYVKRNN